MMWPTCYLRYSEVEEDYYPGRYLEGRYGTPLKLEGPHIKYRRTVRVLQQWHSIHGPNVVKLLPGGVLDDDPANGFWLAIPEPYTT